MRRIFVTLMIATAFGCSDSTGPPNPLVIEDPRLDEETPSVATYSWGFPCPTTCDISSFVQVLLPDLTLRVDRMGEYPPRLYTTTITTDELDVLITLIQDPEFVTYIEIGCDEPQPTDGGTDVIVNTESLVGVQPAYCDEAGARVVQYLWELRDRYFGVAP